MRDLDRLLAYDDWANREALASLRGVPSRRLAHIVGAQQTWLQRLTGGPAVDVWPDLDPAGIAVELDLLRPRWLDVLATGDLDRVVAYTNTKGRRFESTVKEILLHVALHGAYHRGQIAADARAQGEEPAFTDFIHATREKLV